MADPLPMKPDEAQEFRRRRRGRNVAILVGLIAICVLFYAVAMVKLAAVGHGSG